MTRHADEYQEEAWQHSDHVGDEPGPLDEGRGSEAPETEAAPVRDQTPLEPFAGEERRPEPFSPERDVLFADLTTFSVEAHGPAMREADPRVAVPAPESVPAIDALPPREPVVEPSVVPTPEVGPVMEVELHEMPVPSPDAVPDVTVAAEAPLEPEAASIVRLEQKIQATGRTVEREPRGRIPFIREDYVEVDVTRLPHIDPETREEIRPKRDTGLPPADIEDSSEWIDYDDEDYDNEDFLGEKPRKRGGAGTAEEERDERAWDPVLFRQKVAARAAALRRPHKVSVFWVCYAIMVAALVSFALFAFFHTYDSLVRYEVSQPQAFIGSIVDDLMAGGKDAEKARKECLVDKDLAAYDSADLINARFDAGIGRQDLTYAVDGMTDVNAPTYTIYAGEVPYLTLKLNAKKSYVRLGLLSITDWEIVDSLVYDGVNTQSSPDSVVDGLSYEISVADNSHVFVNGNELTQADLSDEATVLAGFEYAARFVDPPEAVTYKVSGFRTEPTIEVKTYEGKDVELTRSGNSFAATSLSVPNRSAEQLPVDVLSWMESWSKLMTQDLGGPGNSYGVDQVNAFLIPGSELYDFINTFVNSVDITFVNGHSLDSFTEESVTNCVMYNENLFSCDIHFVKNMTISGTGMYKGDVFDNNCIFAYVDDPNIVYAPGWYLVNMQANSRSD